MNEWRTYPNANNIVNFLYEHLKSAKVTASVEGAQFMTGLRKAVAEVKGLPPVVVKTQKTVKLDPAKFSVSGNTLSYDASIVLDYLPACRIDRITFSVDGKELFYMAMPGGSTTFTCKDDTLHIIAQRLFTLDQVQP